MTTHTHPTRWRLPQSHVITLLNRCMHVAVVDNTGKLRAAGCLNITKPQRCRKPSENYDAFVIEWMPHKCIDVKILTRDSRGLSEEQLREFRQSFNHFDKVPNKLMCNRRAC